jgi:hypothetical protein
LRKRRVAGAFTIARLQAGQRAQQYGIRRRFGRLRHQGSRLTIT